MNNNNISYYQEEELKEFDVDCISDSYSDSMPELITGEENEMDVCDENDTFADDKTKIFNLLMNYSTIKMVKIFVDSEDKELHALYEKAIQSHNAKFETNDCMDAGFDLYCPHSIDFSQSNFVKIDTNVKCCATNYTDSWKSYRSGYYLYPRSSIVKTNLRMANSVGVIDSGYLGNLIACFDVKHNPNISLENSQTNNENRLSQYTRLVQICDPGLYPLYMVKVNSIEDLGETERSVGGFGSTGI